MSLHSEFVTAPIALERLDPEMYGVDVVFNECVGRDCLVVAMRTLMLAELLVMESDVVVEIAEIGGKKNTFLGLSLLIYVTTNKPFYGYCFF